MASGAVVGGFSEVEVINFGHFAVVSALTTTLLVFAPSSEALTPAVPGAAIQASSGSRPLFRYRGGVVLGCRRDYKDGSWGADFRLRVRGDAPASRRAVLKYRLGSGFSLGKIGDTGWVRPGKSRYLGTADFPAAYADQARFRIRIDPKARPSAHKTLGRSAIPAC